MMKLNILFFSLLVLFTGCAQKRLPPGGPIDKTPPEVVSVSPQRINIGVPHFPAIKITFNEYVDRGSFNKAFRVSPPQFKLNTEMTDFDEVEITSEKRDSLLNETVVIVIGREFRDLHGNNISEPIEIVVSPYDSLPAGTLNGKYYGNEKNRNIQVWLALKDSLPKMKVIRTTGIEKSGNYLFKYLESPQKYIPFAVVDEGRKYVIDGNEKLFLPYFSSSRNSYLFWLPLHNKTKFLPDVEKINKAKRNHLSWQMSSAAEIDFQFLQDSIRVIPEYFYADSRRKNTYHAWWDSLSGSLLTLRWAFRDSAHFSEQNIEIEEEFDEPEFSFNVVKSGNKILPYDSLKFNFSFPLDTGDFKSLKVKPEIDFNISRCSPLGFYLYPSGSWPYNQKFDVEFTVSRFDSLIEYHFETIHKRELGELSGKIRRIGSEDTSWVYIQATDIDRKQSYLTSTRTDYFIFKPLRDGYYALMAWKDINGNNKYERGRISPFLFPEPFWFGSDTLKVRKRWENHSAVIIF